MSYEPGSESEPDCSQLLSDENPDGGYGSYEPLDRMSQADEEVTGGSMDSTDFIPSRPNSPSGSNNGNSIRFNSSNSSSATKMINNYSSLLLLLLGVSPLLLL